MRTRDNFINILQFILNQGTNMIDTITIGDIGSLSIPDGLTYLLGPIIQVNHPFEILSFVP